MPSELDQRLDAAIAALTAPGELLECETIARGGYRLPMFKHAPAALPAYFAHSCAQHGDAVFLVDGELRLSFAETHALALRLAEALIDEGVAPGDRVGIAARNSANWVLLYMAVLIAGGCATLLNGWWTGEELARGIAIAECALVLADPPRAERLKGLEHGARLLVFEHGDPESTLAMLLDRAIGPVALPDLQPEDPATILFTSGSTGTAKGAWSDHRAVVQAAMGFAGLSLVYLRVMEAEGNAPAHPPATVLCLPLFHVTGEVPLLLASFALGRKLVLMPRWEPREALRLIEAERATYFLGVPLMSMEIAGHPERACFDLSSCIHFGAGGAARPEAHVAWLRQSLPHAHPLLGYGLTESNAAGCNIYNENYLAKPGSTGPASRPLTEVAILGEDGAHLPAGAVGEVAIRTICAMRGYWRDPEATAAAFAADGWLRSGDLGRLDDDGYLFIVDRKKDVVIRGGENVACLEVEQAIYAHPAVAEACVFGIADERLGEVPAAVWLVKPGCALEEDELLDHLRELLAPFKLPEQLWQAETPLPRLGSGKLDKRSTKARYADRNFADNAAR